MKDLQKALKTMKQLDLAKKLGITSATISYWKKRKQVPPWHTSKLQAILKEIQSE
jgi:uncharacterized protein YjcR